jgi:pimeloyl-ACP methyl ester carboxylesterase
MAKTIVFLHSPLVGPGTWRKLVPLLEKRGHRVVVPDLRPALKGSPPFYERIIATAVNAIRDVRRDEPLVLVGHSGAGALLPGIAAAVAGVDTAIFVDAILPHPGRPWSDTVPEALKARLRAIARGDRLPPWHAWWPEGAIERLLGNREDFALFTSELDELPRSYFEEIAPAANFPDGVVCSYLQLSEACREEANAAERVGWPVHRLSLNHLAMVTDAEAVAESIVALACG